MRHKQATPTGARTRRRSGARGQGGQHGEARRRGGTADGGRPRRAPLCLLSLVVPLPAPEAAPNRRIGARQSAAAGDDVTLRHHADVAALRGRDPTGQRLKLLAGKTQAGEKRFGPFSEI